MAEKATGENPSSSKASEFAPPQLTLPKGGGAMHGIGEKFSANAVTASRTRFSGGVLAALSKLIPVTVPPASTGTGRSTPAKWLRQRPEC